MAMQHNDGGPGQRAHLRRDTALAPEQEALLLADASGLDLDCAAAIVAFGVRTRRLRTWNLGAGATTDMLLAAALLVTRGWTPARACRVAVVEVLSPAVPTAAGPPQEVADVLQATLESCF
jgi:hypothetical protein